MQTRTLTIPPQLDGRTIRSVLKGTLHFSSHAISRLTRSETGILLNGVRAFTTAQVHTGDCLTVETCVRSGQPSSPGPGPSRLSGRMTTFWS